MSKTEKELKQEFEADYKVEPISDRLNKIQEMVDSGVFRTLGEHFGGIANTAMMNAIGEIKPKQYRIGIDTFQRAKANMSQEEYLACMKFNIDKYNWRNKGQDIDDFKKIIDYANEAISILESK